MGFRVFVGIGACYPFRLDMARHGSLCNELDLSLFKEWGNSPHFWIRVGSHHFPFRNTEQKRAMGNKAIGVIIISLCVGFFVYVTTAIRIMVPSTLESVVVYAGSVSDDP